MNYISKNLVKNSGTNQNNPSRDSKILLILVFADKGLRHGTRVSISSSSSVLNFLHKFEHGSCLWLALNSLSSNWLILYREIEVTFEIINMKHFGFIRIKFPQQKNKGT